MLTKSRAVRKSGEARRPEIVQAALDLVDAVGPEGVTTAAIARSLGLSQAAVFKHFRTKNEVWDAATDALAERIGPRMAAAAQAGGSALERIERLAEAYLAVVDENPAITAFLFYRAPQAGDRALRDRVAERSGRLQALMTRLLTEGREAGEVRPDLDLEAAGALLFGLVQGVLVRRHVDRNDAAAGPEPKRLLAVALAGLRMQAPAAGT